MGWNWGAFLLPVIWGAFNRVWTGLFGIVIGFAPGQFLPLAIIAYVAFSFLMGYRGNEWAWRAKRWESTDHFQRVQKSWTTWGMVGFVVLMVSILAAISSGGGDSI